MGLERLTNLHERIEDLTEEIARKQLMEEDYSKEENKLRMTLYDIQKEAENILKETRWQAALAASAETMAQKELKKIKVKAAAPAIAGKVAARG